MRNKNKSLFLLKKLSQGTLLSIIILCMILLNKQDFYTKLLLFETLPYTNIDKEVNMLFKFKQEYEEIDKKIETQLLDENQEENQKENQEENQEQVSDDIIGTHNVIFQDETKNQSLEQANTEPHINIDNLNELKNLEYLSNKFYVVDKTAITTEDFNIEEFMNMDLKLNREKDGPKILIFHTHIAEAYKDSNANDINDGIYGVGELLKQELENIYGIEVLHHNGAYDKVDGKSAILGAYERMEIDIKNILANNPSIDLVIDLHRDGVSDNIVLTTNIEGKQTAQIMFFNGLSKINKNGIVSKVTSLPNPYLKTNLALSFNMQLVANKMYPGFTRKIYLKPYRFSLHMMPKSLLIEIGAQTNTKQEAFNTVKPLAKILADVVK